MASQTEEYRCLTEGSTCPGLAELEDIGSHQRLAATVAYSPARYRFCHDSASINHNLYGHCQKEQIIFSRSRSYKQNDQAHVEQKNWSVVRRVVGYDCYESAEALALMGALYGGFWLRVNLLRSVLKLVEKRRIDNTVREGDEAVLAPWGNISS